MASVIRRNQKIAHWAKLLIEVIHCFGKLYTPTKKFFRGVTGEFLFKRFITKFNGPVSTSTNLQKAAQFSTGGLVMELHSYLDFNPGLDCSYFGSEYDEKEILFFDAVFQVHSIRHATQSKWFNYKQPIRQIQAMQRIAKGG